MNIDNQLLDQNAYETWRKELPNRNIPKFNIMREEELPDYKVHTNNPAEFAQRVWVYIWDDSEEIENIINTVTNILDEL